MAPMHLDRAPPQGYPHHPTHPLACRASCAPCTLMPIPRAVVLYGSPPSLKHPPCSSPSPGLCHPATPKLWHIPASSSCTHLGLPAAAERSPPDGAHGRGCRRHTGRRSGMPAINPVTVMTRVLPCTRHVRRGFILSQGERLADMLGWKITWLIPKAAIQASTPPFPGIRKDGIKVPQGPLTLPVGAAVQSPRVPTCPLQSHGLAWLPVGLGPPPER